MNTIQRAASRKPSTLLTMVVSLVAASALLAGADHAQARERATTVTGANGQSATRNITRSAGDVSTTTTTGPNGKMASRTVDRSSTGTTATRTGPNGNTATRTTTPTETGSQTSVTGPNGQTGSVTVTRP